MNVGILHLSDLHLDNNTSLDKIDFIVKACKFDVNTISNLYIIVTGDVVNHGKKDAYPIAKNFLNSLKAKIKPQNSILQVHFLLVPGNHDCCYDADNVIRKLVIKNSRVDKLEQDQYFEEAIRPQNEFWKFYEEIQKETPSDKIAFELTFLPRVQDEIVFHCYNSSWISECEEECGNIVMPENKFF